MSDGPVQINWQKDRFMISIASATDDDLISKVVYAYKSHLSRVMRSQRFSFRPVFRDNLKEPSHNRCDYKMSVGIDNRHLKIEITL